MFITNPNHVILYKQSPYSLLNLYNLKSVYIQDRLLREGSIITRSKQCSFLDLYEQYQRHQIRVSMTALLYPALSLSWRRRNGSTHLDLHQTLRTDEINIDREIQTRVLSFRLEFHRSGAFFRIDGIDRP